MLITKTVFVRAFRMQKHYENLGYILPKHKIASLKGLFVPRDFMLEIKVEHLSEMSNVKIEYECDDCKNKFKTAYSAYKIAKKEKGDLCRSCALKQYNSGKNNNNFGRTGPIIGNFTYEHLKGSNNHNWNPNLTDEDRHKERDTKENIDWRISIFIRDNKTCQICKYKGKKIQAHHLNSYTTFKEQRFDINNGITLCKHCHKSYHKAFGYKEATKEKFEQYKNEISCVYFD